MKTTLTDLDYFRTKYDVIYLVKGYYHPENFVVSVPVFWPDASGDRIHESGRRYRKDVKEIYRYPAIPKCAFRIPTDDIVEIYKPRFAFEQFLAKQKDSIWRKIAFAFNEIAGIPFSDIGIFGSYLVGLAHKKDEGLVKDIDFLIYGVDNFRKLKNGGLQKIRENLGLGHISEDHIKWHAEKYEKYFEPGLTNFPKTLKRKWPALQVAPGLLTTIRFIYKEREIPPDPITSAPTTAKVGICGRVEKAEGVHFMPRVFEVSASGSRTFKIVTYFWALYCAVKEGDFIEITGNLHEDGELITVDDYSSGIKITPDQ